MKAIDGSQANGFEASQTIPFPTKLAGDRSARKSEARSQEETQLANQREIMAWAKLLYVSLWVEQERIELLKEKKKILLNHIRLVRSSVRSDSFAAIHLLKVESALDLLDNELDETIQKQRERQLEAASFLNIESTRIQILVEAPSFSEIPRVDQNSSHQIRSLEWNLESARSRELEAKSSWFPDFNLRYKEMGATSMSQKYNEVMIGVTLPFIFPWGPYSESGKAGAERIQKEYELEKERRKISSEKESLLSRARSIRQQLKRLTEKLIPRAEKRVKIVRNLAPRDMETLKDHHETMEAFPDLKIKALDLRMQYEEAIANLEKYTLEKDSSHE
ncbi:MAG: TolC family protein [Bdellovibrionales bacterium]|nr:TolC family protein [Bdellovibrionales bacterium]